MATHFISVRGSRNPPPLLTRYERRRMVTLSHTQILSKDRVTSRPCSSLLSLRRHS
jgi:hypothetical protein